MIKLNDLLNIYKGETLNAFIKSITNYNLEEKNLNYAKIEKNWKFLGGNSSNASTVGILRIGEKGLVERITNAIDAVMEKQKEKNSITTAKTPDTIIEKAFPNYYANKNKVAAGKQDHCYPCESDGQVVLAINDGSRSNKPTFDVVDRGTGISGKDFESTVLSLQHGNKLSADKGYLIGAFGQGGSTSLPFAHSTIIISKKDGHFYGTIIKAVDLSDYKNQCYVYLTINNEIPELDVSSFDQNGYLDTFFNEESGTLVRMIEMDISKKLRDNEITKPGMLGDYINTELFNVSLPVKLIENRAAYKDNKHVQNRNSFGTYSKLQTWKAYVQKNYCGRIDIEINSNTYKIDYYVILPPKEEDWGRDAEARRTFEQFNVTGDPILYTVNGQTITSEAFTKLKNAGLSFLKYRLLVVINLDVLGTDKYKFFTTDRNQIKDTDMTHGFLDKVVSALANVDKLKEINGIIAEKAINEQVDNELIDDISKEVKGLYNKFLKGGASIGGNNGHHYSSDDEEVYEDTINEIEITTSKNRFYKDQAINFVLTTHARKDINMNAMIYSYVNDKANYQSVRSVMNGRIQYSWAPGTLSIGTNKLYFKFFSGDSTMDSNTVAFDIVDELTPETNHRQADKELNLQIKIVTERETICDIEKDSENNSMTAFLCLESDIMSSEIYGYNTSAERIKETQKKIIKPIVLFALFQGAAYDDIADADKKNDLIISFIKAFLSSSDSAM